MMPPAYLHIPDSCTSQPFFKRVRFSFGGMTDFKMEHLSLSIALTAPEPRLEPGECRRLSVPNGSTKLALSQIFLGFLSLLSHF
jgi:hypothetical protein